MPSIRHFILFAFIIIVADVTILYGQGNSSSGNLANTRTIPPVRISIATAYQDLNRDGEGISEFSTPISAHLLLMSDLSVRFGLSQVSIGGDNLEQVNGITDLQIALEYRIRLEQSRVMLNLGMNLPSGKSQLTDAAYETVVQAGLAQYGFINPHFSQGGSYAPGLAFVTSLSDRFVVSLGGTYRFRNAFTPISELNEEYEWGDEIVLTLGAGVELPGGISLSTDVIYTSYGADEIRGVTVFEPGNQVVIQAQAHKAFVNQNIWLTAKYRTIDSNQALERGALQPELLRSFPGFFRLAMQYGASINSLIRASVFGENTWYEKDVAFDALSVFRLGVQPVLSVSPAISIPFQGTAVFGDLSGFEIGVGVTAIL